MPKGVTFCQLKKSPFATPPMIGQLGVACHTPGPGCPGVYNVSGDDPSLARSAIIVAAAALPVAMPSVLAWPLVLKQVMPRVGCPARVDYSGSSSAGRHERLARPRHRAMHPLGRQSFRGTVCSSQYLR